MMTKELFCLLAMISIGCGEDQLHQASPSGVVDRDVLFQKRSLDICWTHTGKTKVAERNAIQDHVYREFTRTNLSIKNNWPNCDSLNSFDISVVLYDDPDFLNDPSEEAKAVRRESWGGNPRVRAWGTELVNMRFGVVLNSTALDRPEDGIRRWERLTKSGRWNFILTGGVHELGHAIGLLHEHSHPDSTCEDFDERGNNPTNVLLTPYDPYSAMNYCMIGRLDAEGEVHYLDELNQAPLRFSNGDIKTVNMAYPITVKK